MNHATLTHGEPGEVANLLDNAPFFGADDNTAALRAALINALRRIDKLERAAGKVEELNFSVPCRYEAFWGEGFIRTGTKEVDSTFFGLATGYSQDDIDAIDALDVGQTWTAPVNEVHTVKRIA